MEENLKKMTCEELADTLWNEGYWGPINSESYYSDSFNSEKYFDLLLNKAADRQIYLSDIDDFNYEKYFTDLFEHDDDKGLS